MPCHDMFKSVFKPSRPHLRAFLLALIGIAMFFLVTTLLFQSIGDRRMRELMVMPYKGKDQGERVQRAAFLHDDVIPVFGSSELTLDVKYRATDVFRNMPTGFQVCPIGRAGNTSILMAEKLAALGERIRGRKVALIFSSSWFLRTGVPADSYAGNFSPLQALRMVRNENLDADLRKSFLARMQEFPATLNQRPLLGTYIRNSGSEGAFCRLKCMVARPLIEVQKAKLIWEDIYATTSEPIINQHGEDRLPSDPKTMDWDRLIAQAELEAVPQDANAPLQPRLMQAGTHDDEFLTDMHASKEWDDFKLLLDTLKAFGANALLISVPLTGEGWNQRGVSGRARDGYYHRFESECSEHGYQAVTFADHDMDEGFTISRSSHFTPKGWLYVDRVLDDFYHDRPVVKR